MFGTWFKKKDIPTGTLTRRYFRMLSKGIKEGNKELLKNHAQRKKAYLKKDIDKLIEITNTQKHLMERFLRHEVSFKEKIQEVTSESKHHQRVVDALIKSFSYAKKMFEEFLISLNNELEYLNTRPLSLDNKFWKEQDELITRNKEVSKDMARAVVITFTHSFQQDLAATKTVRYVKELYAVLFGVTVLGAFASVPMVIPLIPLMFVSIQHNRHFNQDKKLRGYLLLVERRFKKL